MTKAFFIDTTTCTGCRGCQIACKQWKKLPAEKTVNRGSFQNPEDLSFSTYKLVRMSEAEINKKLQWLFFPDQCRHCTEPPCLEAAGIARAEGELPPDVRSDRPMCRSLRVRRRVPCGYPRSSLSPHFLPRIS